MEKTTRNRHKNNGLHIVYYPSNLGRKSNLTNEAVKFPLKKKRTLIGRSSNCDVVINDLTVSSLHAVIELINDEIIIYDLNSHNGTFVEKKQIVSSPILPGSKIKLGRSELKLVKNEKQENFEKRLPLNILEEHVPPIIKTNVKGPSEANADLRRLLPEIESKRLVQNTENETSNLPNRPISFQRNEDEIPSIVYPLGLDSKAEYSEYIFEDVDQLYPIFKYDMGSRGVEVIILHKDRIFSADYLPHKSSTYFIKGLARENNQKEIEFPYLNKDEKIPFITIKKEEVSVQNLPGFEAIYLSDNSLINGTKNIQSHYFLSTDDILCLLKGDLSIFIRNVGGRPKVSSPPFFRRDPAFRRYIFFMIVVLLSFISAMLLYPVNEELEKEKVPQTLRTILYRPEKTPDQTKLVASKNDAISKTEKAPNKIQKSPNQKVIEPKVLKKNLNPKQNISRSKVIEKESGKKEAPKHVEVKKSLKTAKSPVKSKSNRSNVKSKAVNQLNKTPQTNIAQKSNNPTKTKGHVDTYKSNFAKSSLSSILAKGGSTSSYGSKASESGSNSSAMSNSSILGSEAGNIQRAKVSQELGSLTGATTGKLDETKGADGLVNKKSIYTAGIPSKTVVLGSMDPDVIRRILREHIPQFRYCYQKELDNSSRQFSGVVELSFLIGASGNVTKAGVLKSSNLPSTVEGCVVNVLRGIQFPEPLGGGTVEVSQPINFYANVK